MYQQCQEVRKVGRSLAPMGFIYLFLGRGRVRRRLIILSDQVDNFGQDDIVVSILESVLSVQKAAHLGVDVRPGTGTSKVVHDQLNTAS